MGGSCRRPPGRTRSGLTLIELLVAIALLGVAGAMLMPQLTRERPAASVEIRHEGGYIGIGALLSHHLTWDGYVQIHQAFGGAPAEMAGVESGDAILSVDGVDAQNEGTRSVARRIMGGPIGSTVSLGIRRDGERIELTAIRQRIHPPGPMLWWDECPGLSCPQQQ